MKSHHLDAIREGRAYDSREHPEITREFFEERIGGMRDVFTDIDMVIDRYVESGERNEVTYYGDLESTVARFICLNIHTYIRLSIDNLREEITGESSDEEEESDEKTDDKDKTEVIPEKIVKRSKSDIKSYIST